MVRRGLSLEEKREKILDIYHSTKKIYSLKEIEKAASKQGVTSVTVKVSDSSAGSGFGTSNYGCIIAPGDFYGLQTPSLLYVERACIMSRGHKSQLRYRDKFLQKHWALLVLGKILVGKGIRYIYNSLRECAAL